MVAVWIVAHARVCVFFSPNILTNCRADVLCLWCLMAKSTPSIYGDLLREEMQVEGPGQV